MASSSTDSNWLSVLSVCLFPPRFAVNFPQTFLDETYLSLLGLDVELNSHTC